MVTSSEFTLPASLSSTWHVPAMFSPTRRQQKRLCYFWGMSFRRKVVSFFPSLVQTAGISCGGQTRQHHKRVTTSERKQGDGKGPRPRPRPWGWVTTTPTRNSATFTVTRTTLCLQCILYYQRLRIFFIHECLWTSGTPAEYKPSITVPTFLVWCTEGFWARTIRTPTQPRTCSLKTESSRHERDCGGPEGPPS